MERPVLGVIGGSGLLKSGENVFTSLPFTEIDTRAGRVLLRAGKMAGGGTLVFVQRHEATPDRTYTQPADINYASIALALKKVGCEAVIALCSVGSLRESLEVGTLVVPDDYFSPMDVRRVHSDYKGHYLPTLSDSLRENVLNALHEIHARPHAGGVYVTAAGPRFETRSEIRWYSTVGDILGMTGGHEAACCQEVGLQYAMVCMIDNYCHGIGSDKLSLEAFHEKVATNRDTVQRAAEHLVRNIGSSLRADLAELERDDAEDGGEGDGGEAAASASSTASTSASASASAAASGGGKLGGLHIGKPPSASSTTSTSSSSGGSGRGDGSTSGDGREVDEVVIARWVVPVVPENTILDNHAIVIRNGRIFDVLPAEEALGKYDAGQITRLDENHAVMPGMVNAHTHLPMALLKGLGDDLPLMEWLTGVIWPTEGRMVPEPGFVSDGTRLALAESIRGGVTCVNDMYFFSREIAEEVHRAGIRARIGAVVMDFPFKGFCSSADEFFAYGKQVASEWAERQDGMDEALARIQFSLSPHAPYTVCDENLERVLAASREMRVPVHVHLHETAEEIRMSSKGIDGPTRHRSKELCTPVINFKRLGLLNDQLIAVHMVHLSDEEIAEVAAAGSSIVHCPFSNLKLASGLCPVGKLDRAGVNVALGTDSSASNNALDMWAEMRTAATLAKAVLDDATVIPASRALAMATINGAKALHLDHITGSIEVGKAADIIAVDLGKVDQQPVYNVISTLVYSTSRSCVSDVWVAGRRLLASTKLTTIDLDATLAAVHEWQKKVRPGPDDPDVPAHTPKVGEGEEPESSVDEHARAGGGGGATPK